MYCILFIRLKTSNIVWPFRFPVFQTLAIAKYPCIRNKEETSVDVRMKDMWFVARLGVRQAAQLSPKGSGHFVD